MTDLVPGDLLLVVLLLVALGGARHLLRDLRTLSPGAGRRGPTASVSIVVPARDEEATLPRLLRSLQRQDVDLAEILVVDDASRDATSSVGRDAGATVVPAAAPPPGWTGKAWACQVGAGSTTGEILVFLDADTSLAPDAVGDLLEEREKHGGLVSVQPFHEVVRPYEHLSSYFNVVSLLASGAFSRKPGRHPMAFGPCLVTSRQDYERAGGHAAVRDEILDDVQLAAAYRRVGLPVRCLTGGTSIRMRSYPGGVHQLADGWTKNFASGASAASNGPTLAAVLWVSAHHAVAVGAVLALGEAVTGRGASLDVFAAGHLAVWAAAWVAAAAQLRTILRRIGSFRWWTWVLFPVPLIAFDALFATSLILTRVRRSVRWRGREVNLDGHRSVEESG